MSDDLTKDETIRLDTLRLAVSNSSYGTPPATVVARAASFEKYVKEGYKSDD